MPIYDLSTLGTPDNKITFNDFDYQHQQGVLFRIQRRQPTRREIREFDIPIPENSGVADYQTFIGKSFLIIEGTMYPDDETFFDRGRDLLRSVASLTNQQEDAFSDSGYVPYTWHESGGKRTQFVKVMYVDIPEQAAAGIVQPFRLLCKVKYPAIYGESVSTTVGGATEVAGGGVAYPVQYPIMYNATAFQSAGTLNNDGRLAAYPSITIVGPINKPRLTYHPSGKFIEVDVNLAATDTLHINYDQDSAPTIELNGNNVYSKLTAASTFFKVKPGAARFTLTGTSVTSGMRATVAINPAWPVS